MRVTIRQKDIEVTDPLREYIERKIVRPVEKHLARTGDGDTTILDIEAGRTTHHHHKGMVYRVAATLALGRDTLRAEATDMDIHAACDALETELTREIVRYKSRSLSLFKRGARAAKQYLRINPAAWLPRSRRERDEGR